MTTVHLVKYGRKETESLLLQGTGVALMRNADGSLVLEVYGDKSSSYRVRISSEDAISQRDAIRAWARTNLGER